MNKKRYFWGVFFGLLTLFITLFIFWNSLQTGEESGKMSDAFVEAFNKIFGFFGISVTPYSLGVFVRKAAHFTEYFVLCLCFAMCLLSLINRRFITAAPFYCLMVAICDEFIMQRITSGRSPQWTDVLIDFGGGLCALLDLALALYLISRIRKKHGN